jgi:hypothetical protein
MSEQEKQEGQKTVVAFVAGLLIGGLLVWIFGGSSNDTINPEDTNGTEVELVAEDETNDDNSTEGTETPESVPSTPELITGDGRVEMGPQSAGSVVEFESITFPLDDGWIAVRTYTEGTLGNILGASRFSKSEGLVPTSVQLLAPTVAGRDYAIVFFTEGGDRTFNLATDVQIEGVFSEFTAQ